MKHYRLKRSIHSTKHDAKGKPILYASKGETVLLIASHSDVLIVESLTGIRFPVKASEVTES